MANTLTGILGESGANALLYHLGTEASSIDIHIFHDQLPRVFGAQATAVVEKTITKELFSRVGLPFGEEGPFDFLNSLRQAREAVLMGAK